MGIVMCAKHGRRAIQFASERVVRQVELGDRAGEPLFGIRLKWCGVWWICPVHANFFEENALDIATTSRVITVDDETQSEHLLGKMVAVCGTCLSEYLKIDTASSDLASLLDSKLWS